MYINNFYSSLQFKYNIHFIVKIAHPLLVSYFILPCTTLSFFTDMLVLAPTRFGVY